MNSVVITYLDCGRSCLGASSVLQTSRLARHIANFALGCRGDCICCGMWWSEFNLPWRRPWPRPCCVGGLFLFEPRGSMCARFRFRMDLNEFRANPVGTCHMTGGTASLSAASAASDVVHDVLYFSDGHITKQRLFQTCRVWQKLRLRSYLISSAHAAKRE